MEIDRLHNLLEHADSASPPPVVAGGLTVRVLHAARRKAMRRMALIAIVGLTACGVAGSAILRKPHSNVDPNELSPAKVAEIRAELVSLDADAVRHHRAAEEFQLYPARPVQPLDVAQFVSEPDVLRRVDDQRDRAALTLLRWADRTAADSANVRQAGEIYARVARLFPDTPAGRIAADRLKHSPTPA